MFGGMQIKEKNRKEVEFINCWEGEQKKHKT